VQLPGLRGLGVIEVEERRTARGGYPRWEGTPPTAWTSPWDRVYCCPTAAKPPNILSGAFFFLWVLQVKRRADERTRTADLLITSELLYLLSYVGLFRAQSIS
jgi:hypothetical protein